MTITRFDPTANLILIEVRIWGPLGDRVCRMAVDTAASDTLVVPEIADSLGYNPRSAAGITHVVTALNVQQGYLIGMHRLRALGFELTNFMVNVQDLHKEAGIEGLLGLNFLRNFNYEIRSREGLIRVEEV